MSNLNTIKKAFKDFVASGATGTKIVLDLMQHDAVKGGDGTHILTVLKSLEGEVLQDRLATAAKACGFTVNKDKETKEIVSVTKLKAAFETKYAEGISKLETLVNDGSSVYGPKFKEAFGGQVKGNSGPKDLDALVEKLTKSIENYAKDPKFGVNQTELARLVAVSCGVVVQKGDYTQLPKTDAVKETIKASKKALKKLATA